jgi:hypothetical protein
MSFNLIKKQTRQHIYKPKEEKELKTPSVIITEEYEPKVVVKKEIIDEVKKHETIDINKIFFYCVNLKRAIHRKKFMEFQFNKERIVYSFINGIDAENNDDESSNTLPQPIIYSKTDQENKYDVACSCSHLKAIHKAYFNGLPYAFIIEDDMIIEIFNKNKNIIENLLNTIKDKFDIIQLFTLNSELYENAMTDYVDWNKRFNSSAFYLLNRKAMLEILSKYCTMKDRKLIKIDLSALGDDIKSDNVVFNHSRLKVLTCGIPFAVPTGLDCFIKTNDIVEQHELIEKINNAVENNPRIST